MLIEEPLDTTRRLFRHMRKRLPFKQVATNMGSFEPQQLHLTPRTNTHFAALPLLVQLLHAVFHKFKGNVTISLRCRLHVKERHNDHKNGCLRHQRGIKWLDVGNGQESAHELVRLVHF